MNTFLAICLFALPLLVPYFIGWLAGRSSGWKRACKHFAQREVELEKKLGEALRHNAEWRRYCETLQSHPAAPADTESLTFTVRPDDPTGLARACQITAQRLANRNNPQE
jgi:hypothetical protein